MATPQKHLCHYCGGLFDTDLVECPQCAGPVRKDSKLVHPSIVSDPTSEALAAKASIRQSYEGGLHGALPYAVASAVILSSGLLLASDESNPILMVLGGWYFTAPDHLQPGEPAALISVLCIVFTYTKLIGLSALTYKMYEEFLGSSY